MSATVLHSLFSDLPLHFRPLPSIKFFEPKQSFLDYMTEIYRDREVWDIGAGSGFVAHKLFQADMKVVALDIIAREAPYFPVMISNAITQQYPNTAVMLFCRPCHGGFASAAIYQGLRCGVRDYVYAGLPKNVNDDLGEFRRSFRRVTTKVGEENESLYTWSI